MADLTPDTIDTEAGFATAMREAEAESGAPSDAELYGHTLKEGVPAESPPAAPDRSEPDPAVEAGPSESELIAGLGVDEAAALEFLDANPHLTGLLSEPKTDEDVAKNALLIDSLMRGQEAESGLAAASAADKLDSAYAALYSGDPEQTVAAAADLAAEVGLHDPDFEAFVHEWGSHDPDTSVSWLNHVGQVAGQARYDQQVAEHQDQQRATEAAYAQQWQRSSKTYDELAAENPDINNRLDEIAQLAVDSGITPDLMLNPETMRATLAPLHEAARQMDPDVVGSPAWEAEQAANILNAGNGMRFKNDAEKRRFESRLPAGMWIDENDRVVSQPVMNEQAIVGAATAPA
jgi:hypothetical protein